MHVTLIKPRLSGNRHEFYITFLSIEPLSIATVAGLIPDDIDLSFYDDRFEDIPFDKPTDLVGITVDAYSAKRAYAISAEYRKRGVSVMLGGFHPTLMPEEAEEHSDVVVLGEAENIMEELIDDFRNNRLKKRYQSSKPACLERINPRREIFQGKPYLHLHAVEFGRGCKYRCSFCCIHQFYKGAWRCRDIESFVKEVEGLHHKIIMFADDNLATGLRKVKQLLRALISLRIKWISQASMDVAKDDELLSLMRDSGCIGLLIGLESLDDKNLTAMNKNARKGQYAEGIKKIQYYGISINGSFIWGLDEDTKESLMEQLDFAIKQRFIFSGFNQLMPYPGTPLYDRLQAEGRLLYDKWWLDQEDYFGSPAIRPKNFTPDELALIRFEARRKFYSIPSIIYRVLGSRIHLRSLSQIIFYLFNSYRLGRGRYTEEKKALPSQLCSRNISPVEAQSSSY